MIAERLATSLSTGQPIRRDILRADLAQSRSAPYRMRVRISRPSWSLPNRAGISPPSIHTGGSKRFRSSPILGLSGVITGARMAEVNKPNRTKSANRCNGFLVISASQAALPSSLGNRTPKPRLSDREEFGGTTICLLSTQTSQQDDQTLGKLSIRDPPSMSLPALPNARCGPFAVAGLVTNPLASPISRLRRLIALSTHGSTRRHGSLLLKPITAQLPWMSRSLVMTSTHQLSPFDSPHAQTT